MKYITLDDLNHTVRKNLYKIDHNIDFVIGVPRSGMLAATIISEFINVPLIDINSFVSGVKPSGGDRLGLFKASNNKKVLVIDDTTFSGKSMRSTKNKLSSIEGYTFIYAVVYLEGDGGSKEIDLYLEDMRHEDKGWGNICLYEWNLMHHYPHVMAKIMWDLDGVFCLNPTQDSDEEKYIEYISNAVPLFIPKVRINKIVTYRCVKYMECTKEWLKKVGINYCALVMINASNHIERHRIAPSSAEYKASVYKNDDAQLFIESEADQAEKIWKLSGKPVLCIENNKLYGSE